MSWIAVDLDGTLAKYNPPFRGEHIGEPIKPMVNRVKNWLKKGIKVKIFTARYAAHGMKDFKTGESIDIVSPIEEWCEKHIGEALEVTNVKDMAMIELWDDRAIQVEFNTGRKIG